MHIDFYRRVVSATCVVRKSVELTSEVVAKLTRHTLCRVADRSSGRLHLVSPEGWVTEKLKNGRNILEPVCELTPNSSLETFLTQAKILDPSAVERVSASMRLIGITSIDGLANVINASGSEPSGECLLNIFLKTAGHAVLSSVVVARIRIAIARLRLEVSKGPCTLLVTAPHSIMLPRDGHNLHRVEVPSTRTLHTKCRLTVH